MAVDTVGAFCFGLIIGWVTYRTLRRTGETVAVSNIASVVGAVGGAAVTGLFKGQLFGWYCIGLTVGFFGYLALAATLLKNVTWLGDGS
jgi:ABC-type Co2+ transport system permease subunit